MPGRAISTRPGVRRAEICDLVMQRGEMRVEELASRFSTSPETIRRDLSALANAGRIQKIHGGARPALVRDEGPFEERMNRNMLAKRLVAEKVVKAVSPRQTIFIDTGSTTLACAETLAKVRDLTVITNSTRIAAAFAAGTGGAEVFVLGGRYNSDNAQTVGPATVAEIPRFRADQAIITIGAMDARGAMDFSHDEAQVARAMIAASAQVTIVADRSKLGQTAPFAVCELKSVDRLILDKAAEAGFAETLTSAGVEVW